MLSIRLNLKSAIQENWLIPLMACIVFAGIFIYGGYQEWSHHQLNVTTAFFEILGTLFFLMCGVASISEFKEH